MNAKCRETFQLIFQTDYEYLRNGFGDLEVSVLAFGTQVQTRPKPSDFSGEKNPQHAFLRRGSKDVGPMS